MTDVAVAAARAASPRRRARRPSAWHLLLLPLALVMLAPLAWMVMTSLEPPSSAAAFPPQLVPRHFHWQNYRAALDHAPFGRWLANSVLVTVTLVAGNLVLASLAAYAFARLRFFGRNVLFVVFLATLMVPFQVTLIPTFLIVRHLHLIDSLGGLIAPNLGSVFGVFMLRQFFRTLPLELEDAARIDGASRLGVLVRIVLPLSVPALVTLALIEGLWYWNDFLWPLIAVTSPQHMTLQLGLSSFQGAHQTEWSLLMAGTVMSQLPMLALFLAAQRFFVRSVAMTGIK